VKLIQEKEEGRRFSLGEADFSGKKKVIIIILLLLARFRPEGSDIKSIMKINFKDQFYNKFKCVHVLILQINFAKDGVHTLFVKINFQN
jgi:hypothetical protein